MDFGVGENLPTTALATVMLSAALVADDAIGAMPTSATDAAAIAATATNDLRMDLSSSRGPMDPSQQNITERPHIWKA